MPKGKKKGGKKPPAEMPLRVKKHIETLGMTTQHYLSWCYHNGFRYTLDKTAGELEQELAAHQHLTDRDARIDRVLHDPERLIKAACANQIDPTELSRPKWAAFCRVIGDSPPGRRKRAQLCELLLKVNKEADFLFEQVEFGGRVYQYAEALVLLNDYHVFWRRPLADWRESARNRRRQFSSLLRHLLADYPVPAFMDGAWFAPGGWPRVARDWFLLIGRGENIRTAQLPFELTKRMAHYFLDAPEHYAPTDAIRWGQVHGLGGDRRLAEALLGTRLAYDFEHNRFWEQVIRFFINNPLLDRRHVGPIVDYLHHQKFEIQEVMVAPGIVEQIPPPQPGLSMNRRTPETLLRQVDAWHQEVNRSRSAKGLVFSPSGFSGYHRNTGRAPDERLVIRELLSGSDLIREGKAMSHCVATYAESCARGICSIWTMERHTESAIDKLLTIEVLRHGMIAQVRGWANRLPTHDELAVLRRWANAAGLSISHYVEAEG